MRVTQSRYRIKQTLFILHWSLSSAALGFIAAPNRDSDTLCTAWTASVVTVLVETVISAGSNGSECR